MVELPAEDLVPGLSLTTHQIVPMAALLSARVALYLD